MPWPQPSATGSSGWRSRPKSQAFALARVRAAFFAAALRWIALRLRVCAAFFAAALRFAGPPVARSSISDASARRSLATFFTPFGALRFARPVACAIERAARLRRPRARSISNSSSCLDFLAMDLPSSSMPVQLVHPRPAVVSSARRLLGESRRGRPSETHGRSRSRLGGGGVVRAVAPPVPATAPADARLPGGQGPRIERHDRPRPLRRAAHRGPLGGGPLLRPRLLHGSGPALAARVLPARRERADERVRRP